jgi:aquaporin Z
VAIALDVSSFDKGFGWCAAYAVTELAAAAFAWVLFGLIRPEEKDDSEPPADAGLTPKLINEFLGTFMLVLTVGLNVLAESKAAAFSIAASLMCMIYATGDVSGGHYNPAVTLAIFCSGRNLISVSDAGLYVVSQLVGGMVAGVVYASIYGFHVFPLGPGVGHGWASVAVAEIIFTFVLTFVVLTIATVRKQPAPEFIGLAIGSCVTVGGFAIGKVSGGSLNPAVSTGIALADVFQGGLFYQCLLYAAFEFIGGALAAGIFRVVYPEEYDGDNDGAKAA